MFNFSELYSKTELALQSALFCARPSYTTLKLVHVETIGAHIMSFMSVGWGLLADIGIDIQ